MARTFVLLALAGVLVATAWLRLESGSVPVRDVLLMLGFGLVPALAVARGYRRSVVAALVAVATLGALSEAFGIAFTEARPRSERDFFGPVLDGIRDGFLGFYDTELPFPRAEFPLMHSLVLLAVFGFFAGAGLALAARRPVASTLTLLVAVGWPATLIPGSRPLLLGTLALVGVLAVLFLLREGARPRRGVLQALAAAAVLVAVAGAASTTDAVAKGAFLSWQGWDPYDQPEEAVGVRYVWNSHYRGIRFPEERTTVLKVRVPGPRRSLYWRSTTLDEYTGTGWAEAPDLAPEQEDDEIDSGSSLLPPAARDEDNWLRQDFTVVALRDNHLAAAAQPVRWRPPDGAAVRVSRGETVFLPRSLARDQRYTVWSYVPNARPRQLAAAGTNYPESIERNLEVLQTVRVPAFGASGRRALMDVFFDRYQGDFLVSSTRPLYDTALEVVGEDVRSPYAAALALETWFRSEGGFVYDESPPPAPGAVPPLVDFVTSAKRGYCQHYAGAMALMLRLLGVPARVAAGFTSGTYSEERNEWTVTDHQAHTWVEVFFPGYGWLNFDPTPGRGQLSAPYTANSTNPDTQLTARLEELLGGASPGVVDAIRRQAGRPGQEGATGFGGGEGGGGAGSVVREQGPSIFAVLGLLVAAALLLMTVAKAVVRRIRFAKSDPRALASACRRDLVGFLADQGVALPASATLPELGLLIERDYAIETAPFVRTATVARFGPPGEARRSIARARRELRRIRREIRRQLSVVSRLRGLLSIRSLTA